MMTMCCPCSGRPASVTSLPRAQHSVRACLSRERRGRSARKWSTRGQDLGPRDPKSTRCSTPRCVIVAGCGIRAAGARSRSTASASGASGQRRQPQEADAARLDQPGERVRRAARRSASPRRGRARTRSSATSAAPRPISASASADLPAPRGAENQHARARRTPPPSRAAISDSAPIRRSSAGRALSLRRNAKATEHRSQQDATPGPAISRGSDGALTITPRTKPAVSRVIQGESRCCAAAAFGSHGRAISDRAIGREGYGSA